VKRYSQQIVNSTAQPQKSIEKSSAGIGRFIGIVGLYAVLGPLFGALGVNAFLTLLAVFGEVARGEFGDLGRLIIGGMVVGTIYSVIIAYTIGLPLAFGVGFIVAWKNQRSGKISLRSALLAGLGFWAGSALVALLILPPAGRLAWIGALLVAHLVAAAACAGLAKKLFSINLSDQV